MYLCSEFFRAVAARSSSLRGIFVGLRTQRIPMAGRLRAKQIPTLRPGRHGDGGTLFLVVERSGRSRHWVQRLTVNGKRRATSVSADIRTSGSPKRAAAFTNRQLARRGGDPTAVLRQSRAPTFRTACERIEAGATWKGVGAENRRRALERYCGSIMDRRIDQIRRADVNRHPGPGHGGEAGHGIEAARVDPRGAGVGRGPRAPGVQRCRPASARRCHRLERRRSTTRRCPTRRWGQHWKLSRLARRATR